MAYRFLWSAICCALALAACGRRESAGAAGPPGGMPPAPVQIVVAAPKDLEDATEYVATLKSLRSTMIQPQVEGQITRILVKSGDRVRQGTPLVQIDPARQQASVSSQEADRAAKQADLAFARAEEQRARELFAAGAISRQELERAETGVRTADAELRSLEAQTQQRQIELRYTTVAAPTDGVVGDIPVRVGNLVTPQTVLTTVEDNARLEVHVPVPIERAASLKLGLPIQVLGADGTPVASTTASFVSPHVDGESQAVLVKGIVGNTGGLRSDQFVRARIVWATTKGITIPVVAVTRVSGQYFGFVAEPKDGGMVARQRSLKVGPMVGNDYIVLSGIQPNERIIVSGVQKLADGAPVAPAQGGK
jgi:RND family efflux transporter MFP subunit